LARKACDLSQEIRLRLLNNKEVFSLEMCRVLLEEEILRLELMLNQDLFAHATTLGVGMSFGELALNNNVPRAATIRCRTDCHFAVMNKADYQKCLLAVTKKHLQQMLDFLKSLPFLTGV
jgi:CRP-like cAMP-binding protein